MSSVIPFRIVSYNGACADRLDRIITPPYDVISAEEQEAFYQADPLNIIRLVLGKEHPQDGPGDNRYTRAATTLKDWFNQGVLVKRPRPGFTILEMEFPLPDGGTRKLDGVVALVKVDDYGKGRVLPHEKTYKGPKEDQLNLLRACKAHLTPIHALFNDEGNRIVAEYSHFKQGPPKQETVDSDGIVHRTWEIFDDASITKIMSLFKDKSLFIADGHHRYETALAYRNEVLTGGDEIEETGYGYVMMFLTSTSHPGLTILPAHRMVRCLDEVAPEKLLQAVAPYFDIDEFPFSNGDRSDATEKLVALLSAHAEDGGTFGMAVVGADRFRLLRMKSFELIKPLIDESIPPDLKRLDVTILREVIVGHGLGLDRDHPEGKIEYTPSAYDALERARAGKVQFSFLLNPTRIEQVQAAAKLGHKLPHKSTYFYPKLASGLVMNTF